jgi:RNase P/RNase MRP subunit POP5
MKTTLRLNRRYVLGQVKGKLAEKSESEVRNAIFSCVLGFFGEQGFSALAFKLISYDGQSKRFIVRCERGKEKELVACFALANPESGARFETLRTSGTIAAIKRKS